MGEPINHRTEITTPSLFHPLTVVDPWTRVDEGRRGRAERGHRGFPGVCVPVRIGVGKQRRRLDCLPELLAHADLPADAPEVTRFREEATSGDYSHLFGSLRALGGGRVMATSRSVGAAGELIAQARLLMRGWITGNVNSGGYMNAPISIDLLAMKGTRKVAIAVKATGHGGRVRAVGRHHPVSRLCPKVTRDRSSGGGLVDVAVVTRRIAGSSLSPPSRRCRRACSTRALARTFQARRLAAQAGRARRSLGTERPRRRNIAVASPRDGRSRRRVAPARIALTGGAPRGSGAAAGIVPAVCLTSPCRAHGASAAGGVPDSPPLAAGAGRGVSGRMRPLRLLPGRFPVRSWEAYPADRPMERGFLGSNPTSLASSE